MRLLVICLLALCFRTVEAQTVDVKETRVVVRVSGWELVGDLMIPVSGNVNRP